MFGVCFFEYMLFYGVLGCFYVVFGGFVELFDVFLMVLQRFPRVPQVQKPFWGPFDLHLNWCFRFLCQVMFGQEV